jgi:hypothetical protein
MRKKMTPEQAIAAFQRYQDGEKLKDLAAEHGLSQSRLGQMRDKFERLVKSRIAYMVALALNCGSSMEDITEAIGWGLHIYQREEKEELLKGIEQHNKSLEFDNL